MRPPGECLERGDSGVGVYCRLRRLIALAGVVVGARLCFQLGLQVRSFEQRLARREKEQDGGWWTGSDAVLQPGWDLCFQMSG